MNPEDHQRLKAVLNEWQPQVDLPPRFNSEVWRRIALEEKESPSWLNFDWLFRITNQRGFAYAVVAAAVILGAGLAPWQAEQRYRHDMRTGEVRYVHSVDPLSQTLNTNP